MSDHLSIFDELPIEEQVAEASAMAARYYQTTGVPIMVTPNQMAFFASHGVDCTHLQLYAEIRA